MPSSQWCASTRSMSSGTRTMWGWLIQKQTREALCAQPSCCCLDCFSRTLKTIRWGRNLRKFCTGIISLGMSLRVNLRSVQKIPFPHRSITYAAQVHVMSCTADQIWSSTVKEVDTWRKEDKKAKNMRKWDNGYCPKMDHSPKARCGWSHLWFAEDW